MLKRGAVIPPKPKVFGSMVESIKKSPSKQIQGPGYFEFLTPKKPTDHFGVWMHDFGTSPNNSELWKSTKRWGPTNQLVNGGLLALEVR